jgi:HEPN domain-containing protein
MSTADDMPGVLLGLARDDELAARALLPVKGATDAIVGFHAQQAVEKSLKAVLTDGGIEFPYTHDLDGLTELCKRNSIDVPAHLASVDQLTPYGVQLRYGASLPGGLDRDQALRWAADAIAWAQSVIDSSHPESEPEPPD